MKTLGYYNGKFGPLEEMTVPMNDRVCYFGDGVYEATLAKNGKNELAHAPKPSLFARFMAAQVEAAAPETAMLQKLDKLDRLSKGGKLDLKSALSLLEKD